MSLYGATKKANELMAHTYSHLFGLPCTGLRFFTVYGPWGRPDMAYWTFTRKILAGEPLQVFNHGRMGRDFTYVDDVVDSLVRLLPNPPQPQVQAMDTQPTAAASHAPWRVFNIGNRTPVPLLEFIRLLEEALGKKAAVEFMPMQAGGRATDPCRCVRPPTGCRLSTRHRASGWSGAICGLVSGLPQLLICGSSGEPKAVPQDP